MTINTNSCCPKCLIRCRCPDPKAHGHEDKCSNLACDCHTKPSEQVEGWRENFTEAFGAVFSFPPNANNATAHIKGANGIPQVYAGRYDTHTILDFIDQLLAEERAKMRKEIEAELNKVEDHDSISTWKKNMLAFVRK